jgi:hypothetical protein
MSLPVWRQLRTELHPQGLEIVTVALDLEVDAAGRGSSVPVPSIRNSSTPPPLDELLGVVNVPSALWVDENG